MPHPVQKGLLSCLLAAVLLLGLAQTSLATPVGQSGEELGVLVVSVVDGSPADVAGIVRGDIIISVDGTPVNTPQALTAALRVGDPGEAIAIAVQHGDELRDLSVLLSEVNGGAFLGVTPFAAPRRGPSSLRPPIHRGAGATAGPEVAPQEEAPAENSGQADEQGAAAETGSAPAESDSGPSEPGATDTGAPTTPDAVLSSVAIIGAVVAEVVPDSPAAAAGLVPGDVITAVNGEPVTPEQDLGALVSQYAPGDEIQITMYDPVSTDELVIGAVLGAHPDDATRPFLGLRYAMATTPEQAAAAPETAPEEATPEASEEATPVASEEATPEASEEATPEASEEATPEASEEATPEAPEEATPEPSEEEIAPESDGEADVDLVGAAVIEVVEGGPAAAAGLVAGDLITAVDGEAVTIERDLAVLIGAHAPGDVVQLTVLDPATDVETIIAVTLGEHPDDATKPFLGVSYALAPNLSGEDESPPFGRPLRPRGPHFGLPSTPDGEESEDDDCDCSCWKQPRHHGWDEQNMWPLRPHRFDKLDPDRSPEENETP